MLTQHDETQYQIIEMSQVRLQFTDVRKQYGKQQVLNGINLQLREGEFLGLAGVNGAGKTTLIKCLLDMASINSGAISIAGLPHTNTEARAALAFLPEKFLPPYYLTGRDFLNYMTAMYGVTNDPRRTESMLTALDFNVAYLDKPVRQMSKGMSQKLGLVACFLSDRSLYILDEPMSGLDPRARACLKRYLLQLKQQGRTVFFSTHLLSDVESLCDRAAILHEGAIRFIGTPAECCEQFKAGTFEEAYLNCVAAHK